MTDWLLNLDSAGAIYLALFFMLMGGAVGLPVPEDIPLILAGVAAHQGSINWQFALLICYTGVVSGDIVVFFIGWYFGTALFDRQWFKARFPPKRVSDLKHSVEKRSLPMIFIARHLFYLRTATFLTCGAVRMSPVRFFVSDAIAALVSVPLMIWLGFKGSEQIEGALQVAHQAKVWSLVILGAIIVGYAVYRMTRKHKESQ